MKPKCARCGSARQRNLKLMDDGTYLCMRCRQGEPLPDGDTSKYRYRDRAQYRHVTENAKYFKAYDKENP